MLKRLNPPQRPPSRLDNIYQNIGRVSALGIPDRLISAYRPFPPMPAS